MTAWERASVHSCRDELDFSLCLSVLGQRGRPEPGEGVVFFRSIFLLPDHSANVLLPLLRWRAPNPHSTLRSASLSLSKLVANSINLTIQASLSYFLRTNKLDLNTSPLDRISFHVDRITLYLLLLLPSKGYPIITLPTISQNI